jgi:hypothetical protein
MVGYVSRRSGVEVGRGSEEDDGGGLAARGTGDAASDSGVPQSRRPARRLSRWMASASRLREYVVGAGGGRVGVGTELTWRWTPSSTLSSNSLSNPLQDDYIWLGGTQRRPCRIFQPPDDPPEPHRSTPDPAFLRSPLPRYGDTSVSLEIGNGWVVDGTDVWNEGTWERWNGFEEQWIGRLLEVLYP